MKWKDPDVELPPEGRYVIIHVPGRPWNDLDSDGVFYKIACCEYGITIDERNKMNQSDMRVRQFKGCDEGGNNERPYCWREFGPGSFFGQEVAAWREIPRR